MTVALVALAAAASAVAFLCGRYSGFLQGWRDCSARGNDAAYRRGWNDRVEFEKRGGKDFPAQVAKTAESGQQA